VLTAAATGAKATANASKNNGGSTSSSPSSSSSSGGSYSGGGGVDYMSLVNQWQNQMRQAAEEAYNRGKRALEDAYNARTKSLLENHNSAKDQLINSYNTSKSGIEADSAKSLREAYINNMLNKRDMNQLLSAQGLSGGASESTLAKMLNSYGNNRNNINTVTNRNLLELETSHNANLAEALRNYNEALADAQERRTQYLMQLEQNRANGIANSVPAFGTFLSMFS
jgi:hypothetical protein